MNLVETVFLKFIAQVSLADIICIFTLFHKKRGNRTPDLSVIGVDVIIYIPRL